MGVGGMMDSQADEWCPTYRNETHQYGVLENETRNMKDRQGSGVCVGLRTAKACVVQASAT
ncbi:hypothetical protein N7516_010886 [Penicillium verrucosum]|uniref:uncharacterized protein n=1 Tax=Penicillium verrucosum TaxID=60171 RepID=UPI0025458D37|nr:uncharacterized protein N7516_010886 [Penicillium verrucosum]KAJ5920028.1 hypothetical protein N7516_010886 [Penicillium verrucosum]